MTYGKMLLNTYVENIEELEFERAGLTYYPGYDGEIVEKFVICKRPNCACHRGYPHEPNKYFRHREGGRWVELYLGKKIIDDYIPKVESNKRIREIYKELRSLRKVLTEVRERLGLRDENFNSQLINLNSESECHPPVNLTSKAFFVQNTN